MGLDSPVGDGSSRFQTTTKFGSRDVGRDGSLGDLIRGHVLVGFGDVGHLLEGNHLNRELLSVLGDELLGVVRS